MTPHPADCRSCQTVDRYMAERQARRHPTPRSGDDTTLPVAAGEPLREGSPRRRSGSPGDTWTPVAGQSERTYRRLPDSRQPVQIWGERIATGLACFLIGFVLMLAALR